MLRAVRGGSGIRNLADRELTPETSRSPPSRPRALPEPGDQEGTAPLDAEIRPLSVRPLLGTACGRVPLFSVTVATRATPGIAFAAVPESSRLAARKERGTRFRVSDDISAMWD